MGDYDFTENTIKRNTWLNFCVHIINISIRGHKDKKVLEKAVKRHGIVKLAVIFLSTLHLFNSRYIQFP